MKVFLAHKQSDLELAARVQRRLRTQHRILCHQYAIDEEPATTGEAFAHRVSDQMETCTHVLAVVSAASGPAPWVLWQAGLASGRDLPMTVFFEGRRPPEFLERWPNLLSMEDVDKFGDACKEGEAAYETYRNVVTGAAAQAEAVRKFYCKLRETLAEPDRARRDARA